MVTNNIKTALIEAHRYEDIKNILNGIISDTEYSYPVNAYSNSDGKILYSVSGYVVRYEASKLMEIIETAKNEDILENINFKSLSIYVNSRSDNMLHNFAVDISHRQIPSIDIDTIRNWEILDNLITVLYTGIIIDDEDGTWSWDIPKGWKKLV